MLKRLFSYFIPVNIYKRNSAVSKSLEVSWNNGRLVLDSHSTNYSYGSLQRILRKGLKEVGFDEILKMNHILVLGVAGGSVVKTLVDEVKFTGKITGVEIDRDVVELANLYFRLDQIPNLTIIIDDAFEYVLKTDEKYDLIIVDIFQDSKMPTFLFERVFADRLTFLLNINGYILFNTMKLDGMHDERNEQYISGFDPRRFKITTIPRVENHNELIVVKKLA